MSKHRLILVIATACFTVGNLLAAETLRFSYDLEGDTSHADEFKMVLSEYTYPQGNPLFEMTWFPEGSCRYAVWTKLSPEGATRTQHHAWNWATSGGGDRKPLNAEELSDVKKLLDTLPDSAVQTPRALLLFVSFLKDGKRIVRAYDRSAPPEAILKLDKILDSRLESGPVARGEPREWETPSTQLDVRIYWSFTDSAAAVVAARLSRDLGRPIRVDPALVEQTPVITLNIEGEPLRQAVNQFAAKLNANVYFMRGVYWISKDKPAEVLPEPLDLPPLSEKDERAADVALRELQSDDLNTREAAGPKLIALGTGVLKQVAATMAARKGDVDLQTRLAQIDEALRAILRDGTPSVRLKIQLRLKVELSARSILLKKAAEDLASRLDNVPKIEMDEALAMKVVSVPEFKRISGYAAFETLARAAGCRLQIKGNTVRFLAQ
jgi:hypothetical protein